MQRYKVPVPEGGAAFSAAEAVKIASSLSFPVVVKAQIHAGGRGKGGGVKFAADLNQVEEIAAEILGMTLVTRQTGPKGKRVGKLLLEEGLSLEKELYLSIVPDRATADIAVMVSEAGGMDIEEVAADSPERLIKVAVNPLLGLQPYQCRELAFGLKLDSPLIKQFSAMLCNLYQLFMDKDCSLLEINPLVITTDQRLVALDAKINFDDNALFRHQEIQDLHDPDEDDPLESEAGKYGLNYIKLSGNVGNMVNGAGLAMATMDIIKLAGASPANFLDVGGGASSEMVENGFRIILRDKSVKGILVNIFGGMLRCDVLARGVVRAAEKTDIKVPVVVRMEGTNVEEGRKILAASGLNLITATDLKDAAFKVSDMVSK